MNQNRTVFNIDEETDAFYLQKAVQYHEWLIQQEAQPRLTRTPIFRDREDAERRLSTDYFDDHFIRLILSHNIFISSHLDSIVAPPKCGIYSGHGSWGYHVIIQDSRITSHDDGGKFGYARAVIFL
ncbi:hypothetical protein Tco_0840959 [Tanacetum coccineum]|uniref:Uncharacterized protein n=1 Tax=Tanacetum coccineum TaxID=301880 RepID=A0ABQ5AXC0_9ASTR